MPPPIGTAVTNKVASKAIPSTLDISPKVESEVVMVPRNYTDNLRELICKTKAGVIGNYTDCSVSTNVIGTFKPNDKANPTIGKKRMLEKVKETKLEVICNVENVKEVLEIIKKNHPYETPGIDIIPLMDESYFN